MSTGQGDVSVKLGFSDADLLRGQARVAQSLDELAKVVERLGTQIDKVMAKAAADAEEAAKATRKLTEEEKQAAEAAKKAADERRRLAEETRKAAKEAKDHERALEAEKKALAAEETKKAAEATRRLAEEQKRAAEQAQKHKQALDDMREGLGQISAAAAVLTAALAAVGKSGVDAFKQQQSAFSGLEAVASRTVGDINAVKQAAQSLATDGLMTVVETSKAVQAGLASGFDLTQTSNLIKAFKDSAAFNRQAGLEFGEAVVRAMDGVRMGNSVLSDAAGITKNLSVILREAGKSEQDLQNVQSDLSVRVALYNGILKEAALFQGNAAKSGEQLAGAEAKAAAEAFKARAAFGEALAPAVQTVANAMTIVLGKLGEFASSNPGVARSIFLVVGGITAVTAAVGGLAVALLALNTALGLTGWLILGASAAAGALGGMALSAKAAQVEAVRTASDTAGLIRQYEALRGVVDDNTTSTDQKTQAQQRLKDVTTKLFELQPQMQQWFDNEGKLLDGMKEKYDALSAATLKAAKSQLALEELQTSRELEDKDAQLAAHAQKNPDWVKRKLTLGDFLKTLTGSTSRADIEAANLQDFELEGLRLEAEKAALQLKLEKARFKVAGLERPMTTEEAMGPPLPKGGTGSGDKDPMKSALRYIDFLRNTEEITTQVEIAMLEEVKARHAKTAEEEMDVVERLHAARKRLAEETKQAEQDAAAEAEKARKAKLEGATRLLDHELRLNQIGTADEIKRLQEILATHKVTDEERMALKERLAGAQKRFADEVAGGLVKEREEAAKTDEARVQSALARLNHQQRLGKLSRDEEIAALEAHLQQEAGYYQSHADERWAIEERIYGLRDENREADKQKQKKADDEAKKAREELLRTEESWIQSLANADLKRIRDGHQADQRRQQDKVKGLQDELDTLERLWAAEERSEKLSELRKDLAKVMADTRFEKIMPDGSRVFTYDEEKAREIEKQIGEAERDERRTQQRQELQDKVQAAQDELTAMRDKHQAAEAARQEFWNGIQGLDIAKMEDLAKAAEKGLGEWVKVFDTKLGELKGKAQTAAEGIRKALDSINLTAPALVPIPTPTLPASLAAAAGGASIGSVQATVNVTVNGATDPQATAAAVKGAASDGTQQGVIEALVRSGRAGLRVI